MSLPSRSFSDSSEEDYVSNPSLLEPSASRVGSPSLSHPAENGDVVDEDSVTCLWDNCGVVYTHLPTLINHIHDGEFVLRVTVWCFFGSWLGCQYCLLPANDFCPS